MTDILLKRSTGGVYFSTPINEGAKRVRKLMEDDYITLPISTQNPLDIRLGDYVDIPNEGRFCIIETQYPSVNEDNGGYDYDLKFEAQYRKWGNKIYKYHPDSGAEELSWKLTASIDVHTEQVKKAINALGTKNPSYKYNGTLDWDVRFDSTIDHKVAKFIAFDNINILDAISAIAEVFECEWWVDDNILKFGRCEIGDTEVVLSKEVNLTSISRSDTGEKIANRIYPFGSTENLPKSYREDLVFYITNYDINDRTFSDKIRPLSHKWFDKSDIELSPNATTTIKASQLQGTKSGNISANVAPQSSENVLAFSKSVELSNLPYGTNRFDLTGVNISVSCSTDNNRVLSSILAEVVVSWEYLNESGAIIGRDSVSTQLIGAYIASIGQTYSIVLPESLNAKIEQFYPNANGIKEQVTTINCKLLLNVYCQFSATGTANVNISTMNTTGILVYAPQDVYRIKLNIKFLSGELDGNTYEAYYNNTFAREEEYANVIYLNNADVELLTTGDAFEITNINEAWIPVSYFSESMHSLDKDTINAIADKRLLLPEGMKPYIDAYRYANGDKVYIGEDGYDDATEMPLEEAQEDVVIFEDIKPDYTFEITKVWEESKEMTEDGVKRIVYKFFFYEDLFGRSNQFGEQYRIEGKDLMIRFSSGQLNGMEFKLHYWNETDYPTRFEVEVDENSNLPNKFFKPVVGDTFTMSGLNTAIINIEYLPKAEQRLFEKSTEYLIKSNLDNSAYDCIIKSEVMFGEDALVLDMGQRVFLKEETFLKEGRHSRVIGYEYPLDIPYDNPKYTIGEKASYSRIGDIESKLDNIEFSLSGEEHNNASTIIQSGFGNYIIGTNDDTSPSNTNVLSSLRSFVEFTSRIANESINYLWKFFKGIEIGNYLKGIRGASITQDGDAEVNSLQSRNGIISNNIHTTDFVQGALMGVGGAMYQLNGATYAEFDYLTARKGATFAELIIQEYRSIAGSLVVSEANGEIESVYKYANGYNVWLKDVEKNSSLFEDKDLVRCQYWDRTKNEFVQYWVPVSVGTDASGKYVLTIYNKHLNGVEPQVGDKLVHMGNTTNKKRQGCILITTENGLPRISILDGIDQPRIINTTEKTNYKSIYGSLDGFVDPYTGKALSGYGMWGENVHLHGDLILSSTNKSVADSLKDVGNGRNLLLGTNNGTQNWSLGASLYSDYLVSEGDLYNGYKGVHFKRLKITENAQWEVFKYVLRPEYIEQGKPYHISFDIRQGLADTTPIKLNFAICTGSGTNHLADSIGNAVEIKKLGEWQHCDIEFTPHTTGEKDGQQGVYLGVSNDTRNRWTSVQIVNLKLERGVEATEWSQAPEDAQDEYDHLAELANNAQTTAENAQSAATEAKNNAYNAQLSANNAKERLDAWAEDGVISPNEKQGLKDELARIEGDYNDITDRFDRASLDSPSYYIEAYNAYTDMLRYLINESAISGKETTNIPEDFAEIQENYYNQKVSAYYDLYDSSLTSAENAQSTADAIAQTTATLTQDIININNRLDGVVENWFYPDRPKLETLPTSNWTTAQKRYDHVGDTYTCIDESGDYAGKSWRWVAVENYPSNPEIDVTTGQINGINYIFYWQLIVDSDAIKALQQAKNAQDTADGKRRVFVAQPKPAYDEGDLWVKTENGVTTIYYCVTSKADGNVFDGNDWELASTDDSALQAFINGNFKEKISNLQTQIDGKAETWYQESDPSKSWITDDLKELHTGDMWYKTTTNTTYRWNGSSWDEQNIPKSVFDTIDGKAQIFVSTPTPPYYIGDLWVQGEDGDIMRCMTSRVDGMYNPNDWKKASKYTDDTELNAYKVEVGKEFQVTDGKFESMQYKIDGATSARNLLLKAYEPIENKNYLIGSYNLGNAKPKVGDDVTLSFIANVTDDRIKNFRVFNSGGVMPIQNKIQINEYGKDVKVVTTFTWNINANDGNTHINIYQTDADLKSVAGLIGNTKISKIKLEFGTVATDWSIAPEETDYYYESRIKQTAESIEFTVKNGLTKTGIDIESKKITVTADNFSIQNNKGETTTSVDAQGNLAVSSVACRYNDGDEGTTPFVADWNAKGDGIQRWYYPNGNIRAEVGWDNNTESFIRKFDENGILLWKIGNPAEFMYDNEPIWVKIILSERYLGKGDIPKNNTSIAGVTYYKKTNVEGSTNNSVYKNNVGETLEYIDDGWYTDSGMPFMREITSSIQGVSPIIKYVRKAYHYESGKLIETSEVMWDV